ncbi:hypothetical protein ACFQS3_02680 [Glycomyces mayteni]|uniref:H-type lectin domain-containing protein n=1 Tax=Glycomyces mayteni TaxID=543887 RepID=A0ABW2D4N5_9ACTN
MTYTGSGSVDIHAVEGVQPPAALRQFDALLLQPGSHSLAGTSGVRAGQNPIGLTGTTVEFRRATGVIQPAAGGTWPSNAGPYRWLIPSVVNISLAPASAQTRIDMAAVELSDTDVDLSGARIAQPVIYTGTPGSGVPPTLPEDAVALATFSVPVAGAPTMTRIHKPVIAVGGIVPVASQTERDALVTPWDGLTVYRKDTDVFETWNGIAWDVMARTKTAKVLSGTVAVTPVTSVSDPAFAASYYRGTSAVSFPVGFFSTAPNVTISAVASVPGLVIEATVTGASTTGFTANLARSSTSATTLSWIAVENG